MWRHEAEMLHDHIVPDRRSSVLVPFKLLSKEWTLLYLGARLPSVSSSKTNFYPNLLDLDLETCKHEMEWESKIPFTMRMR